MKSFVLKVFGGIVLILGLQQGLCADTKFKIDFQNQNLQDPQVNIQTSKINQNLVGTGVANGIFVLPPCRAVKAHYHPRATESNIAVKGKFDYFVLDENNEVVKGTAEQLQTVNYPQGYPHMLYNPYGENAVIQIVTNSENPGVFFMDSFVKFDDEAVITGEGQSEQSYLPFKQNVDPNQLIGQAKGNAYLKCLKRNNLPLPYPETYEPTYPVCQGASTPVYVSGQQYPAPSQQKPDYPYPSQYPQYPQPEYPSPSQPEYPSPSQPEYPSPPQPEYPSPPQPYYPSPPQPYYPSPPQPDYPSPPQPEYPSPPQPEYPSPPQPEYPSPPQPDYPSPLKPDYPSPPKPDYPSPQKPDYPKKYAQPPSYEPTNSQYYTD